MDSRLRRCPYPYPSSFLRLWLPFFNLSSTTTMPQDTESATERTALLYHVANDRRLSQLQAQQDEDAESVISSAVTKEEGLLKGSAVGERLKYNDYTTIDWLHDLVCSLVFNLVHFKSGFP